MPDDCPFGGRTKPNGNCSVPGDDGVAVQCVGPWTKHKHDVLSRYIAATRAARAKYLPPALGGAAFIDLFAGPGRARVRESGELIDGSPLIAVKHVDSPFTKIICCDAAAENVDALKRRTESDRARVRVLHGDCNELVDTIVAATPAHGLNLALIDPFGLAGLRFETLARLGSLDRMDLIVFFPVGEMRRFLDVHRSRYGPLVTGALGTSDWQTTVRKGTDAARLIPILHRQLQERCGYTSSNTYSMPIRAGGVPLYHLVFASKHARGDKIWESVTRRSGSGQGRLF